MSEQPSSPPRGGGGGRENVFTHKIGPLPMWAWVAIIGGGLIAYRLYSNKSSGNQNATAATTSTADQTSANQVPQFVNQTYVTATAPSAPGSGGTSPTTPPSGSWGGIPTNPSPVSTVPSTQPKPTTTTSGWSYPAPSGLQVYDQSNTGIRLSWNAVTGPSGQHPNSYSVVTYNSNGKQVSQHDTTAGNTNTAEYGPGGKGLPKGTYHTNVWANGGPIAPPHASVQYTLKG